MKIEVGTKVRLSFAEGAMFEREIARIYPDGSFKLAGGMHRYYPYGDDARRKMSGGAWDMHCIVRAINLAK